MGVLAGVMKGGGKKDRGVTFDVGILPEMRKKPVKTKNRVEDGNSAVVARDGSHSRRGSNSSAGTRK